MASFSKDFRIFSRSRLLGVVALLAVGLGGCAFRQVRESPSPESLALVRGGDAAYERMDFQEAWGAYQRARALGVRDGVLFYRLWVLGDVLKKKSPAEEVSSLQREAFRLLNDSYGKTPGRPAVYFYLAQLLRDSGKDSGGPEARLYAEAIRDFEAGKSQGLGPMDMDLLGRMYASLGFPDRAERLYSQALRENPRNAFAVYDRARLYQQTGRIAQALAEWERFAALVPRDPEGYIRLGESALEAGDWVKALTAFQRAIALDSSNALARRGFRRAKESSERNGALTKARKVLRWEVGFETWLSPLTLPEDELHLADAGLGPPVLGSHGTVAFATGSAGHFSLYTVSPDGVNLVRRIASSEGFTAFPEGGKSLLAAAGSGPRRHLRIFNLRRGTVQTFFQGECGQPFYAQSGQVLLCTGPEGATLRNIASRKPPLVLRGPGSRHPRLGRDGQTVVLSDGGEVIRYDTSGKELGRFRPGGQDAASAFPDVSSDGKWIVSGGSGLFLTSVAGGFTVGLNHPELRGAGRASFTLDGRGFVFVKDGRLFRLEFSGQLGSFASMRRAEDLLNAERFGLAVKFLSALSAAERNRSAFHLLLAQGYMGLKLYGEAEAVMRKAGELDSRDWRPQLWLGKLQAVRKNWKEAFALLDQAIRKAPTRFEGYLEKGRAYEVLGRTSEAITEFQEALRRLGSRRGSGSQAVVQGLLDAYVKEKKVNEALLLLLDHGNSLSAAAVNRVRTAPGYLILHSDPRFQEVLGRPFSGIPGGTAP